jgi:hypothetical protein
MPFDLRTAQPTLGRAFGVGGVDAPASPTGTRSSTGHDRQATELSGAPKGTQLAALFLQVADTLERSAQLAEEHAERRLSDRQWQSAATELERARQARTAAARGRAFAARLGLGTHGQA